jgi:hypothetical protein
MPPDNGLGTGLERAAGDIEVDIEKSFLAVSRIARRKRVVRASAMAVVALVVVVGAAIGGVRAFDAITRPDALAPAGDTPSASTLGHEAYGEIAGTYVVTIPSSGGVVSRFGLRGRWEMTLHADGSLSMRAPLAFERRAGVPFAASYSLSGEVLQTSVLRHTAFGCTEPGVYRWRLSDGKLSLTTMQDGCEYRPAVLASRLWQRQ